MKASIKNFSIASFAAVVITGCYTEKEIIREPAAAATTRTIVRETVVVDAPPVEQVETVGVPPSGEHVWIPGHWSRSGDRWVWISGQWEARPTAVSVYVPGHWESRGDGYVWREGYWK